MNQSIVRPSAEDPGNAGLDEKRIQALSSCVRFLFSATPEDVAYAADSESEFVRGEAASHTNATADIIARLLGEEQPSQVRASAAANPKCPAEMLRRASTDPDENVRAAAAGNTACPEDIVRTLSTDPSAEVRAWAASNPSCPEEVLATLVRDRLYAVRIFAEDNPRLPTESRRWLDGLTNSEYESDWTG
jgi:hypothetical protein